MTQQHVPISVLGNRICILGPSNSGKSTLAAAIAHKCDLPVVHLDQLFHTPNTDWKPRPSEEFAALHAKVISGDRWVIDGNYSKYLPERFARATGVIALEVSTATSLFRYFRRTVFEKSRYGGLEGGKESLKWQMIRHIAVVTPGNRARNRALLNTARVPTLRLYSLSQIDNAYEQWELLQDR